MRQTSQAVLLLLSAASATQTAPGWSAAATAPTVTLANQGKWLGNGPGRPVYRAVAQASLLASTVNATTDALDATANKSDGTLSCVQCIKGQATNKRTIWCSAGWNYEYTELALDKDYPKQTTGPAANAITGWVVAGTGNGSTALAGGDQGACCYTIDKVEALADLTKTTSGGTTLKFTLFNKWTCPAKYGAIGADAGPDQFATLAPNNTNKNWWCSDGSYNLTNTAAYATDGATAMANEAAMGATSKVLVKANLNGDNDTNDRRDELILQACRQRKLICGAGHVAESSTASDMKRTIVKAATGGFSSIEKCTWVLRSKTKAPTFAIGNTTTDKQLPSTVDVIYQEWVDGWQITGGVDFVTGWAAGGTAYQQGGVPIAAMASAKYAKAYKWNYASASMTGSTVQDATTNNSQRAGEAWVYQADGTGCKPALSTGSDKAGDGTTTRASCLTANKTQKRWISLDVSGATYLNAVADNYATKLAAFNTDAAAYNKYLADLKTANEKDAFSAFFSPPKKPAMVKRPGAPTTPATYTGLQHWPASQQTLMLKDGTGFPTTDGKQYVLGNNLLGGWGAWTISRLAGGYNDAKTNLISHSFGMLGTTQSATVQTGWSYAKQWQKGNEAGDRTVVEIRASFTGKSNEGGLMCTAAATAATHACGLNKSTGTAADANTAYAYLNVSVWTNTDSALTAGTWNTQAYDPYIQFYASAWADGKAYYAPAAAAAGTALSEPAGAQALAASAAAVLAAAAALY